MLIEKSIKLTMLLNVTAHVPPLVNDFLGFLKLFIECTYPSERKLMWHAFVCTVCTTEKCFHIVVLILSRINLFLCGSAWSFEKQILIPFYVLCFRLRSATCITVMLCCYMKLSASQLKQFVAIYWNLQVFSFA